MDIIKTIESWRRPERVREFLSETKLWKDPNELIAYGTLLRGGSGFYVFQLGRGEPKRKPVERMWFVFQGKIYGHFKVARIERNVGQFEELVTMYKREGLAVEWHLRDDNWVVICNPPFNFFEGHVFLSRTILAPVFYTGFQGWRYFDLESYSQTVDARHPL